MLHESTATETLDLFSSLSDALSQRRTVALCTVVRALGSSPQQVGAKMLVFADGPPVGTVGGGKAEALVMEAARERLANGSGAGLVELDLGSIGMECGGAMAFFVDVMRPTERLFVFGAGHVGRALTASAAAAGYHVVVVDDRPEWADATAIPEAGEVVVAPFEEYAANLETSPGDLAVIVTRGHDHDETVLRQLVPKPLGYLGMMGSRRKVKRMMERLRADGVPEENLAVVDAPLGLPIGAVTPAELAISITGRLIAVRRGATPAPLGSGKGVRS